MNKISIIGNPIGTEISALAHALAYEASKNHDCEIVQIKKDIKKFNDIMNDYSSTPTLKEVKPIYDDSLSWDFPERSRCRKFRNISEDDEEGYKKRIQKHRKKNKNKKTHRED